MKTGRQRVPRSHFSANKLDDACFQFRIIRKTLRREGLEARVAVASDVLGEETLAVDVPPPLECPLFAALPPVGCIFFLFGSVDASATVEHVTRQS